MVVKIQIQVFWVVMHCDTTISEDLAASFLRVKCDMLEVDLDAGTESRMGRIYASQ
jgi:hypothetical protein